VRRQRKSRVRAKQAWRQKKVTGVKNCQQQMYKSPAVCVSNDINSTVAVVR
jgi:hypothetical protein